MHSPISKSWQPRRFALRLGMDIFIRSLRAKALTLCDSNIYLDIQNTQDHWQTRTYTRAMHRDSHAALNA